MPNTLTTIFTSTPATEPVEAPHPNTGVYVTGTQAAAGGPWTVVHTLVTKTATGPTMVGRLKNFPAITATIVASGPVLNNVLTTPTGTSATPNTATPSTALTVMVSSILNSGGYRLFAADAVGGPFAQLYQSTTPSFSQTNLVAGQTKYYQWQYVGNGQFYDDSLIGSTFSGTTTGPPVVLTPTLANFTYNVRSSTDAPPHSALASLFVQVSGAAYVDVEYTNTRAVTIPDQYGVAVNSLGTFDTAFVANGVGTLLVSRLMFNNTSTGIRQFIEGVQERNTGDTGVVSYTQITKLTFPGGSTAAFQPPTANTDRLLVLGDSKSVGVYATGPQTAWINYLRGKRPAIDVYSDGWGYRRASVALVDAPTRAVLVANAVRLNLTRYVVALSTNDRSAGLDPITVMALVTALADELRVQLPNIIFYIELEYNNGNTANTNWRSAAQNSRGTRGTWYRFIDPGNPTTADGTHPTDAGQFAVAGSYDAQLDAVPGITTLTTAVYLHAYDANNTGATWYDNGSGAQNAQQVTAALQPTIVAGALFGKAAYYFAPGANHYMDMAPLAATSQAYTIIMTLRSVVAQRDQFYLDIQAGRIVLIAGGWGGVPTTNQASYYTAPGNNQASGARGPTMQLVGDSFIALALDGNGSDLFLNGNQVGSYPVGVTAISTGPRIGAAFDVVSGSTSGQFQGYIGLVEIHPTKLTAAQIENRRQVTGSVTTAATGFLEDGLLTYSGYPLPSVWPTATAQGGTHDGIVHFTNVAGATAAGIGWGTVVSWVGTGGIVGAASTTFNVINVATGATAYSVVVDLSTKPNPMQTIATTPTLPFGQYQAQIVVNSNNANIDGFNFA